MPAHNPGPYARALYDLVRQCNVSYETVELRAGLSKGTLARWFGGASPKSDSLQAALEALGADLQVVVTGPCHLPERRDRGRSKHKIPVRE
jgi:transcriptional regulator with XRE-family HTH domain